MRFAINAGPIGFGIGMVLDPGKTVRTIVINNMEAIESVLGPANTTSRAADESFAAPRSEGEPALSDTDQLEAIAIQEIVGQGSGALFSRALGGVASFEAREASQELCPGGVCLFEGQCLVAGTLVSTPSGLRPIESLKVGDTVSSRDAVTGESSNQRVSKTFVTPDRVVLELTLVSAGRTDTLRATPQHPFNVEGQGWVAAGKLEPEMRIRSAGEELIVKRVRQLDGYHTVYNIEVENTHTYFVGRLQSWVHNACPTVYARNVGPGMYAHPNGWIPLRSTGRRFWMVERKAINDLGARYGCHSCGTYNPGTSSGNWVIDHQIPVAFWKPGMPLRGYPQCATCGLVRGGSGSQPNEILNILNRPQ
jgi:hypothetical protein